MRGGIDLANDVVGAVGDEEVAVAVHRDTRGSVELGAGGRAPVATVAAAQGVVPRDRGNHARGIDLADDVVAAVGDEEDTACVYRDAHRVA